MQSFERPLSRKLPALDEWRLVTRSGNPSSYKAVIEANESGRPAVEKLEPFYPGLVVIVAVRGSHLKGGFCTPHVPV